MNRLFLASVGASLVLLHSACSPMEPVGGGGHGEHAHHASDPSGGAHAHHGSAAESTYAAKKAVFALPDVVRPGEAAPLAILLRNDAGEVIETFDVNHEKLMHLIVVSEDLSHFEHRHPAYDGQGTFRDELAFPAGGRYKLFADFVPSGGGQQTIGQWIDVEGKSERRPVEPDAELVKTDGKRIELAIAGLAPNAETMLTFTFRDAASDRPIDDLEPYLGAVGHVVMLSEDAETYLHVHPADDAATGPEATFRTSFPASGIYKIWGQFQHEGRLITVPFVVHIPK
ncbi:MAG TPA: hypothetical protein VEZ72_13045 [Paenibacillus sp.]|nr:hypothetical protein [Paenibacillus sp.]